MRKENYLNDEYLQKFLRYLKQVNSSNVLNK